MVWTEATWELLTAQEVAAWLRIDVSTVLKWVREKRLPAVRIGKAYRFRRSDVYSWYEGRRNG